MYVHLINPLDKFEAFGIQYMMICIPFENKCIEITGNYKLFKNGKPNKEQCFRNLIT